MATMTDRPLDETYVGTLDADELIAAARAATGLHDFGAPDVREPIAVLVEALNRESYIKPEAEPAKRASLIRALSNRLRLNDQIVRHPEIEKEVITKPIFIVGLPRSGTTKIHRVLAADPEVQKLPLWRLLEPVATDTPDQRLDRAQAYVDALRTGAPEAYAAHPMYADQPDEEVFVMELAFLANINATAFRAPSFEAWINAQSFDSWYVWFKRLLQYIQWADSKSGQPWVLKAPHHLGFMPRLFADYPDATVVHCHRDPMETIPSHSSLAYASRRSTSFRPSATEAGRYVLDYLAGRTDIYLNDRAAIGQEEHFVDVSYLDIVRDATAVAETVYATAGIPFTDRTRAAIAAWEGENEQHKHGGHKYSLDDFGLTHDEVATKFAGYTTRFAPYLKRKTA